MKISLSEETLANVILAYAIVMVIIIIIVSWIAHQRGVNISSRKFVLTGGITFVLVGVIPFWLTDMPVSGKIEITVVGLTSGVLYYLAISKLRQRLKDY